MIELVAMAVAVAVFLAWMALTVALLHLRVSHEAPETWLERAELAFRHVDTAAVVAAVVIVVFVFIETQEFITGEEVRVDA